MQNFLEHMQWGALSNFLLTALAVLVCLTVHETCHGLAAYALGDPTAKSQNRLSLNPLRHLDPFGTLMMLVAGFGWAKPVPVDMRYFKHPKSGMAITALAGPVSNFLLAYLAVLVYAALFPLWQTGAPVTVPLKFLMSLALMSVGLGLFNLIPIPPLDGSKVLEWILPDRIYYNILRYETIGMLALMALIWLGAFDGFLSTARQWVLGVMIDGSAWLYQLISNLI